MSLYHSPLGFHPKLLSWEIRPGRCAYTQYNDSGDEQWDRHDSWASWIRSDSLRSIRIFFFFGEKINTLLFPRRNIRRINQVSEPQKGIDRAGEGGSPPIVDASCCDSERNIKYSRWRQRRNEGMCSSTMGLDGENVQGFLSLLRGHSNRRTEHFYDLKMKSRNRRVPSSSLSVWWCIIRPGPRCQQNSKWKTEVGGKGRI